MVCQAFFPREFTRTMKCSECDGKMVAKKGNYLAALHANDQNYWLPEPEPARHPAGATSDAT